MVVFHFFFFLHPERVTQNVFLLCQAECLYIATLLSCVILPRLLMLSLLMSLFSFCLSLFVFLPPS